MITVENGLKIGRKMMKQLLVTGAVILVSMLIIQFNRTFGILLMMGYSSWMMVKGSRHDMVLGKFTAILPGAMSLLCFLVLLLFLGVHRPIMPLIGIVLGLVPGFLKARGHRIYNKDGKVFAQKTYFYILIWTGSLLFTQGATLLGLRQIAEFGFLLNGFSTTMAVILSLFLFMKVRPSQMPPTATVNVANIFLPAFLVIVSMLMFGTGTLADTTFSAGNGSSLGTYSGAPPANENGVRFGKTTYQLKLHPEVVQLLETRKGRWHRLNSYWQVAISDWSFSGGQLIVDWDTHTATMTPSRFSYTGVKTRIGKVETSYSNKNPIVTYQEQRTAIFPSSTDTSLKVYHTSGEVVSVRFSKSSGMSLSGAFTNIYLNNSKNTTNENKTGYFGSPFFNTFTNATSAKGGEKNRRVAPDNFLVETGQFMNMQNQKTYTTTFGYLEGKPPQIIADAFKFINIHMGHWDDGLIFRPVKTIGRVPASPRLVDDVKPDLQKWSNKKLTGKTNYTGQFLKIATSAKELTDIGGWTTKEIYKEFYSNNISGRMLQCFTANCNLQIDWDTHRAVISSFAIQKDHGYRKNNVMTRNMWIKEHFYPVQNSFGEVHFNSAGLREIVGGKLTYTSMFERFSNPSHQWFKNPVTFRGQPVKVSWQGVPQADGKILVRLFVRPWMQNDKRNFPASFDLIFTPTSGTSTLAGSSQGNTAGSATPIVPPITSTPSNQNNTDNSALSLATPDSDSPSSSADQDDNTVTGVEQFLNSIEQGLKNVGFSEQAAAAGVAVALIQILAGLGMGAANSAAFEVASAVQDAVNEGLQEESNGPPQLGSDDLLDENGEPWQPNEDGLFGLENDDGDIDWMTRQEAEDSIQEELDRRDKQDQESNALWDDIQQDANALMDQKGQEGLRSQQVMAEKLAAEEAAQAAEEQRQADLLDKLDKIGKDGYSKFEDKIADLKNAEDWAGLQQIYHDRLNEMVHDSAAERDSHISTANNYWLGEKIAQGTKAASKGALMVLGGPAGMAVTGVGVGAISAAEDGAEKYYQGGSLEEVLTHSAGGFVSGFKDGALSVYLNMPGTSKYTQVLLPAGTDGVETYIRTGDGKQALAAAGYSIAGDLVGMGTDKIGSGVTKEFAEAGTTAAMSGIQSYTGGGNFMDGVGNGLLNHAGGKLGGMASGHVLQTGGKLGDFEEGHILDTKLDYGVLDPDQQIKQTMSEAYGDANQPIKTEDLPDNIQKLNDTRYTETDVDGNQKEYVDTKQALDQLADTQGSRDVKHAADQDLTEAMIRTRDDKIYGPPNEATLNGVKNSSDPDTQAWLNKNMQEGDTLEMDNFSTPGTGVSLGADRDVRMVVKRYDPATGKYIKIEVPLQHWGDQAQKDYFDHSEKIYAEAGLDLKTEIQKGIDSGEGIYADRDKALGHLKQPELSDQQLDKMRDDRRSRMNKQNEIKQTMYGNKVSPDEMSKMTRTPEQIDVEVEKSIDRIKHQGLTNDQILHQTYSQANNQLFTDKFHMEASRANSDQGFNEIRNQGVERTEVRANVLEAKDGKQRLEDPDGFGRMWDEKSHFYHNHPSEALAQSKKGISDMISLRDGQRTQGLNPAAFKPETAQAMEVIIKAPTGSSATPEAMAQVNQQIQSIRDDKGHQVYKDMNDAMSKVGRSVEYNKWTPPHRTGLSGSEASRLARLEQEREWARRLQADASHVGVN